MDCGLIGPQFFLANRVTFRFGRLHLAAQLGRLALHL
jgi:hypothetical protein